MIRQSTTQTAPLILGAAIMVAAACAFCAPPLPGSVLSTYGPVNPTPSQEFGFSVAATKKHVAVGAPANNRRTVRVFESKSGEPIVEINSPQASPVTRFGQSLSAIGTTLMIGEPGAESAYKYSLKTFSFVDDFTGPADSELGRSVLAAKKFLGAGAPNADDQSVPDAGLAYFFDAKTGSDLFGGPLAAGSAAETETRFGESIAAPGSLIAVGAPGLETATSTGGAVYLFDSKTGSAGASITAANAGIGNVDALWGAALGGGKKMLVIGAPNALNGAAKSGVVRVMDVKTQTLFSPVLQKASGAEDNDEYGRAVVQYGKRIAVGAPGDDGTFTDQGRVYVYDAKTLDLIDTVENPAPVQNGHFGASLASDGKALFVGAPGNFSTVPTVTSSGQAYKIVSP